jgi:hypothetical protein
VRSAAAEKEAEKQGAKQKDVVKMALREPGFGWKSARQRDLAVVFHHVELFVANS